MENLQVEIIQPQSTVWTGPVIATIALSFVALAISVISLCIQRSQWRHDGALVRLEIIKQPGFPGSKELDANGEVISMRLGLPDQFKVVARNVGRRDARIGSLFIAKGRKLEECSLGQTQQGFPPIFHEACLEPGAYAEAILNPEEINSYIQLHSIEPRKVRLMTYSQGKPISKRISLDFIRYLRKKAQ